MSPFCISACWNVCFGFIGSIMFGLISYKKVRKDLQNQDVCLCTHLIQRQRSLESRSSLKCWNKVADLILLAHIYTSGSFERLLLYIKKFEEEKNSVGI